MSVISIFGSGNAAPDSTVYKTAELTGKLLAENGFDIATGAYLGVMEGALKGASECNIKRIGITTNIFKNKKPNSYVNSLIKTDNYFDRLKILIDIADAYIVFPGGSGTLLEFSFLLALKERNIINNKPMICIGEQWKKVLRDIGFNICSDSLKSLKIDFPDDANNAVIKVINYIK